MQQEIINAIREFGGSASAHDLAELMDNSIKEIKDALAAYASAGYIERAGTEAGAVLYRLPSDMEERANQEPDTNRISARWKKPPKATATEAKQPIHLPRKKPPAKLSALDQYRIRERFAQKMREEISKRHGTQKAFCLHSGISRRAIQYFVDPRHANPSLEKVVHLARALEMPVSDLVSVLDE